MVLSVLMVFSIFYFIEAKVQPEAFGSIPDAMWWGIATLHSGYGDIYPATLTGRYWQVWYSWYRDVCCCYFASAITRRFRRKFLGALNHPEYRSLRNCLSRLWVKSIRNWIQSSWQLKKPFLIKVIKPILYMSEFGHVEVVLDKPLN